MTRGRSQGTLRGRCALGRLRAAQPPRACDPGAFPRGRSPRGRLRLSSAGTFYDGAGNLLVWNGGASYEYDALGNVRHYTSGSEDWVYMYTADDERAWAFRTGGSGSIWTLRDLDGKVLRGYTSTSGWVVDRDYVYRGDKLLSAVTPQGARHFHVDHLGSVRQATSSTGTQVAPRRRGSRSTLPPLSS
ncbi:MAG TPA: hypothetical protein VMT85_07700 [Thermoanaerobaculia bacterium]|nr:hypothetical protein [Thermoanaerobaculia bacterium]